MHPKFLYSLFFLFLSYHISAQKYLDLIRDGETSVSKIENEAEQFFDQVGRGKGSGYKFYQRWLYLAKIDGDENGNIIQNKNYLEAFHRYNRERNFSYDTRSVEETASWSELGPTYKNGTSGWNPGVGRITAFAFENSEHFIVGSPSGGVWKTTDSGENWTSLTDNLSNIDVYALSIHPGDSDTYYWGSTEGRIFKSSDGGISWSILNSTSLIGSSSFHVVNKILINPDNTNILYASVEYQGIFRSVDGGSNWSKIHAESFTGYDIEFKPGDSSVVYATGNSFFSSTDNGETFSKHPPVNLLIGNPDWSQELVSGNTAWSYSSTNLTNTITPKTGGGIASFVSAFLADDTTRLVSKVIDLSDAPNAWLSFSYTNTKYFFDVDELIVEYKKVGEDDWSVLATYEEEATQWTDIIIDLSDLYDSSSTFQIAFKGKSNFGGNVTLDDVAIYDSLDTTYFSEGFESRVEMIKNSFSTGAKMMGVSADEPNKIYLVEERNSLFFGLFVSEDEGQTFSKLDHEGKNYFGYSSFASDDQGQAPRDMDISVDPNNADIVYLSGILSWRSDDGAESFTITSQWTPDSANLNNIGYCHADIDITELVDGILFVGTDGGIFKAEDPDTINSSYYEDLSDGLGVRQFYKIGVSNTSDEIVTGGAQDNGTSVLSNSTWKDWLGADGMETFVDKNDSNKLYGTSQHGNLYVSTDQGQTRSFFLEPPGKAGSANNANWIVPFEQDPSVTDKVYVAYDEVFSKEDDQEWVKISQTFNGNIDQFKIAPNNNAVMYLSINDTLYKTSDGGQTDWEKLILPESTGNINAIAINKDDSEKVALAVSGLKKVVFSEDGGISWEILNGNLPEFSASAITFYGEDLILGMNYGVFYSHSEERSNWESFSDNLPNVRITELEINDALNKVYAATYGRGLWAAELVTPILKADKLVLENIEVYPNPVTDFLKLQLKYSLKASIKIYNEAGQVVYYSKSRLLSTNHSIAVNHFAPGIYVIRVTSSNHTITFKIIKK